MTEGERDRGRALGAVLRAARASRSAAEIAQRAGISLDTLRKIERGAIASPAFFTVVALARALDLELEDLAARTGEPAEADSGGLDGPNVGGVARSAG